MKRTSIRILAIAVLAAAAAGGCKKDKKTSSQQGSGSDQGATPVEPPKARPSQQPQPQLPALDLPDDPKRADKIALGHQLFFDQRLSGKSDRSCYSCHQNEDGTGGHDPLAIGSGGKQMTRHAPALWNVGYWKSAGYWDGRAKSLEANVKGAWSGGNMGGAPPDADTDDKKTAALDKKAVEIAKLPGYKKLFEAAFGTGDVKADHINQAIAEYMRTLVCKDTAYDKYAAGDRAALSEPQQRGLDIFMGKGQCNVCHAPPFFSSAMGLEGGAYFNVGIGTKDVPDDKVDIGRKTVTKADADWAAFKPPSLRNVTKTPPYFHDGSAARLEDAVMIMTTGGIANKNKTTLLKDAKLTDAERADLIAFLGGLACGGTLEQPPKLPEK